MGLCVALMCSAVVADEAIQGDTGTIVITYNKTVVGRYIIEVTVDNAGNATVAPVTSDYHLGEAPGPGPGPGPGDLTVRGLEIKREADIVQGDPNRAQTAAELAAIYRAIADKVTDGEISGQAHIALAVKYGGDFLLNPKPGNITEKWQQVRVTLNDQWIAVVQEGGQDADYAKLLYEASDGLDASSGLDTPQIDIAMIIKIIKMILEILALIP